MEDVKREMTVMVTVEAVPLPAPGIAAAPLPLRLFVTNAAPSPPSYCPLQPRLGSTIATFRCVPSHWECYCSQSLPLFVNLDSFAPRRLEVDAHKFRNSSPPEVKAEPRVNFPDRPNAQC